MTAPGRNLLPLLRQYLSIAPLRKTSRVRSDYHKVPVVEKKKIGELVMKDEATLPRKERRCHAAKVFVFVPQCLVAVHQLVGGVYI